jgi:hypothetical protein
MRSTYVVAAAAGVILATSMVAEVRSQQLIERCGKDTVVMERVEGTIKPVANTLDGFCEGYLLAAYEALVAEGKVTHRSDIPSADYLRSVFNLYVRDHPAAASAAAYPTVRSAYLRAFPKRGSSLPQVGNLTAQSGRSTAA